MLEQRWSTAVATLGMMVLGVGLATADVDVIAGEALGPDEIDAGYVETLQAAIDRDRLAPMPVEGKVRGVSQGYWMIPPRGAAMFTDADNRYAINKWGDTRMGIGFHEPVAVSGAVFFGQGGKGVWTPAVRAIGYRAGQVVGETEWFTEITSEPRWLQMDFVDVDRLVIESVAALNGGGWYGMDDLTFTPIATGTATVVDFDGLDYRTKLTGGNYAGLIWEVGAGQFVDEGVPAPQTLPRRALSGADPSNRGQRQTRGLGTAPTLLDSFQGVLRGDAGSQSYPPDTDGAIGPNHYVETVNRNFAVYNKATGAEITNILLGSFLPGSNGDPRVLFDHHSGRWVVIVSDFDTRLYLAVSLTDDPTGSWYKTNFLVSTGSDSGCFPDYETLGVDENGIYTAAYMAGCGMTIFAIDKAPLIDPSPSLGTITAFRGLSFEGAIQPVHSYDTPGGEYFISLDAGSSNKLRVRQLTGPLTSPTLNNLGTVTVASYGDAPTAPALGSSTRINTVDARLMMSVYGNGSIWTAHTVSYNGRAACRWYEVDPVAMSLVQSGTVADSSLYYYFPSLMVNSAGSVVMAFSGSDASQYVACYYTGRRASDPAGEMADPIMFKAGTGAQNNIDGYGRNRWGDYSYTTLDPVDGATFWTIQEYGHSTDIWGTYIAVLTQGGLDCNNNGLADECDIDCNAGPGCNVPGCGQSQDCNGNYVPDECEAQEDCNQNGTQDICDIASGFSQDCNGNQIPDECEQDCNGNGVPDDCDLASGASQDCNENGTPDECDITAGTSQDCQPNGVPDECDLPAPDAAEAADNCADAQMVCPGNTYYGSTVGANSDGSASCATSSTTADVWYYYVPKTNGTLAVETCGSGYDTALSLHDGCPGLSSNELDCNDDYCYPHSRVSTSVIAGQEYWIRVSGWDGSTGSFQMAVTGPDCDAAVECNNNGIPDECELDCNSNGLPDDCDIADNPSLDQNGNGIIDDCEGLAGDVNCDGLINFGDIDPFVLAITDSSAYAAQYPDCNIVSADVNGDGLVNFGDIDPFVALLTG